MSTSNDPEPALSSFELFPKLPNCLKFMIWEDFYLEPRYFFVDGSGNSRVDDTVEWVMKPRPRKKKYYTAIDTELDPLASNVARTIRPELTIEASKGSAKAEHVKINWRLDFVHLRWRDGVHQCKALPDFKWVAKVQNLVLDDTIADVSEFDTSTEEIHRIAMLLWHRRESFLSLRNLILQRPSDPTSGTIVDSLCFQMRYLIREAPKTPPHWKEMRVEAGSRSPWLDIERPSHAPPLQWKEFIESWRLHPGIRPLPVTLFWPSSMAAGTDMKLDDWLEEEPWPLGRGLNETEDSRTVFENLLLLRPLYADPRYNFLAAIDSGAYFAKYRAMVKKFIGGKERE
ncbi:hypothetical protein GQ607_010928 [Colletotrichum asianum]|uniref:Uncharacterized protein n=1 Tax=Colletotrichum asianum TaxID=702518 RepID=A0A8H3W806_9PEZI|nr:hypothetical protein GQ607_010928 [Colletotrichum asianum]